MRSLIVLIMQLNYPVIICGAGPTGLMLAAQLLRFKIDFIIIDKKSAPTTESRAVVVQARSMEIYEQMNLSDKIIADAVKADGICFWRHGKKVSEAKFENLGSDVSPFDFVIMYEQSKNETLLYHHLQANNYEVEWNTEFISNKEDGSDFIVTIKQADKEIEIKTKYIVACDGAKSKVRELAAMEFSGGTYENVFYVADTHVQADVCNNSINFFVANDTFNLLFPMVGDKRFRAIGILPKQFHHQNEISFTEVSEQVKKDAELDLGFNNTQWYSTYRLHHKKVKTFSKGNIFFCGDAAHVHSPAGGQGMNTGLQDAYNLAWKLALVINGEAKKILLNTYHEERNPIAESLLKTTDRMFNIMSQNKKLNVLLRMYIVPAIMPSMMSIQSVRKKMFQLISQTEINYEDSSLSNGKAGKIKAGMRFPYVKLSINNQIISVFHLIRNNADQPFLLLTYNVNQQTSITYDCIKTVHIEKNSFNDEALNNANFSLSFYCLLRPDNYISYIDTAFDAEEFYHHVQSFLK
jgi:2-polyprenyl-6-methoxyphenol hydroxylase-like FAD-dependent oxidoreductase